MVSPKYLVQNSPESRVTKLPGTVSFDTLTAAFGPSSLGIIIVKDLPSAFTILRKKVLSNASYLAAFPQSELGQSPLPQTPDKSSPHHAHHAHHAQQKTNLHIETLTSPESKYLVGWSCGKETLKSGHFDTLKGSYYVNCAFYQDPSLDSAPADDFLDLP
jgi:hypothetical protein